MVNIWLYCHRDYRVHRRARKKLGIARELKALGIGYVTVRRILRGIKGE